MPKPLSFPATIKNGELFIYNHADFLKHLESFKEDQKLCITVARMKEGRLRSLQANNYYWHILGLISDFTGEQSEDLHEIFKRRFLPYREVVIGNQRHKIAGSTADLNTVQFYEYVDKIKAWAKEFGILIPEAGA